VSISVTAKSKFEIGTTAPATSVGDFDADTYTAVKGIEDLGEFGDEAEEIKFSTIEDARVRKLKGVRDAGKMDLVVGFDALDPGQVKLRQALASDLAFNFHITLNDAPTTNGTPTEYFFKGKVMSARTMAGKVNDVVRQKVSISIDSEPLIVPAATGA
jgi:hypothetical protein